MGREGSLVQCCVGGRAGPQKEEARAGVAWLSGVVLLLVVVWWSALLLPLAAVAGMIAGVVAGVVGSACLGGTAAAAAEHVVE